MPKKFIYNLLSNAFNDKDIKVGIDVLKSRNITISKITNKFEKYFAKKIGAKYALMTNSGSSANLLAFSCLTNPLNDDKIDDDSEVIIPAVCWSTSLWPIIQSGLKPKFVDIDLDSLNINLNDLKKKISKKTKAILIVHVLGNCVDMSELMRVVKKHNLILIEDTCESLGTKYKNKYLGTFGDFSSFSFYSSHQISSGEGGMICCKNNDDHEIIKSLRAHGWSRGLKNEKKIAAANKHLDSRFIFYNSGFNLRSTDIAASIGLNQFKDIDQFIKKRSINRDKILKMFKKKIKMMKYLSFIDANNHVEASWFGIPILLSKKINRNKFLKKIEKLGVETRPIISGNFLKQPSIKKYKLNKKSNFKNSDIVNNHGFFIGLPTSAISDNNIKKLVGAFEKSL